MPPPNAEDLSPAADLVASGQMDAFLAELSPEELQALPYHWEFWARPKQLPPEGEWFIWLLKPGRGFGKTRAGAEYVRARVERGEWRNVGLVNDTLGDTRRYMIEGESGLLAVCPKSGPYAPAYEHQKGRVSWPNLPTGPAYAHVYAAEAPEAVRGANLDGAWADEAAKWRNLRKRDAEGGTCWDNLLLAVRTGPDPRVIVTTTPRAIPWLTTLQKRQGVAITRGSTYENRANLADVYYKQVIVPMEGTRLGRQEIHGEEVGDVEGALWNRAMIESSRVQTAPQMLRVVVAVDPSVTAGADSNECGIVVVGLGADKHGYVLDDQSGVYSPRDWATLAVRLYKRWRADRIVAEVNQGGEMVEYTVRTVDEKVAFKAVRATRGKRTRAEPVSALYEKGTVHHVGLLAGLEDQMCTWDATMDNESPDRVDALVWGLTYLMLENKGPGVAMIHAPQWV